MVKKVYILLKDGFYYKVYPTFKEAEDVSVEVVLSQQTHHASEFEVIEEELEFED